MKKKKKKTCLWSQLEFPLTNLCSHRHTTSWSLRWDWNFALQTQIWCVVFARRHVLNCGSVNPCVGNSCKVWLSFDMGLCAHSWRPCRAVEWLWSNAAAPVSGCRCWWADSEEHPGWSGTWTVFPHWWCRSTGPQSCLQVWPTAADLEDKMAEINLGIKALHFRCWRRDPERLRALYGCPRSIFPAHSHFKGSQQLKIHPQL